MREAKKHNLTVAAKSSLKAKSNNELASIIKFTSDSFLKSVEWKELRIKAFQCFDKKCMKCGYTKGRMNVDHIKPRKFFPELALTFSNLQILCSRCNKKKGNLNQDDFR